jgi:hypothetical protein
MRRALAIVAMSAVLLTSAACDDDPAGIAPLAGAVTLQLTTPHVDDGALLFDVTGPPIDSVTAASSSLSVFTRTVDDSVLVGLVAGGVVSGPLVVLHVRDISAAAAYSARIAEVADHESALRASLAGYTLSVTPWP